MHFQPNDLYGRLKKNSFSVINKSKVTRKNHWTTIHSALVVSPPTELHGVKLKNERPT